MPGIGRAARLVVLAMLAVPVAGAGGLGGPGAAAATEPVPGDPATVVAQVSAQAAFVESGFGTGSGWPIRDDVVITNYHVARVGRNARVTFPDGTTQRCYTAAANRDRDLAALVCSGLERTPIPVSPRDPVVGEPVTVVGYPGGEGPTVTTGTVRELGSTQYEYVRFDAITHPGSSGSPVVNARGEVVSVATRGAGGMSLGPSAAEIEEFIDDAGRLDRSATAAAWRIRMERSALWGGIGAAIGAVFAYFGGGWRPKLAWGAALGVLLALGVTQIQLFLDGPTRFLG